MHLTWSGNRGSAMVFTLLLIPVLLAMVGLVLDGALVAHQQLRLETAIDAAARAATDAYDRQVWQREQRVVIDLEGATGLAQSYLHRNLPAARLVDVKVQQNQVHVQAAVRVELVFMKIFGIQDLELMTFSTARKS